jgi:hypothetical protein
MSDKPLILCVLLILEMMLVLMLPTKITIKDCEFPSPGFPVYKTHGYISGWRVIYGDGTSSEVDASLWMKLKLPIIGGI